MPTYKSPDVYVTELSLLPPSTADVATAVPAFIGYTQRDEYKGVKLTGKPTRIKSLVEYKQYFGEGPDPKELGAEALLTYEGKLESVTVERRFHLFDSLSLFFDNGGGPCYVVSVGTYAERVISKKTLLLGLEAIKREDEPTLLVIPEAAELASSEDRGEVYQKMLKQCEDLQDRFAILDVKYEKDKRSEHVQAFRTGVGMRGLKYGAAYYPYVRTTLPANIRYEHIKFRQQEKSEPQKEKGEPLKTTELKGLGEAKGVDPDDRQDEAKMAVKRLDEALADRDALKKKLGNGEKANSYPYLFRELSGKPDTMDQLKEEVKFLCGLAGALREVAASLTSPPLKELASNVTRSKGPLDALVERLKKLDLAWKSVSEQRDVLGAITEDIKKAPPDVSPNDINDEDRAAFFGTNPTVVTAVKTARNGVLNKLFQELYELFTGLETSAIRTVEILEVAARMRHTVLQSIFDELEQKAAVMPPSGAIAGVYAYVDNSRGVWKAPANVSLASVAAPAEPLDSGDQENLNVDVDAGKSINVLRAFTGKGTLVWGARTLAGNDNEWRYVSVRRFFIMIEESVKKATAWAVFEPNDANTWVRVKSMIENFLTEKWRDGALAGARPVDAFFVKVGLGSTMTPLDILEGRMLVEIGMAVVRPAEFIILRFSHKLQTA